MRGPYSLSPNHEFGLRVDGWDTDPAVLNPHNRDYYARHYEALGLVGVRDWHAYWLDHAPSPGGWPAPPSASSPSTRESSCAIWDMANWDEEILWFWDVYNDGWEHNWGHTSASRMTSSSSLARGLKQMADPEL